MSVTGEEQNHLTTTEKARMVYSLESIYDTIRIQRQEMSKLAVLTLHWAEPGEGSSGLGSENTSLSRLHRMLVLPAAGLTWKPSFQAVKSI
jgi:hypothetical protein